MMSTIKGDTAVLDWNNEPEWASEEPGVPTLAQFAGQSSLHGLSHVVGPRSCSVRRCLWTLAFCGSLSFLVYHYVTLISYYFMYPHITKLEEVAAPDMDFPAITFCNVNRARFSRLNRCDIHHIGELWSLSETAEVNLSDLVHQDHLEMLTHLHSITEQEKGDCKFDWEELYNRTAHDLWDMVKSCHFGNDECVREDFNTVYTRYGKCYTFNGNRTTSRKTKQGGMGNGLEIMLDIQQDEYLPIWRETNETTLEAGIRVQIHSQDEPPYIHQLGFGVSPGFQTFVSCQEQRLTYLPQPWGNCRTGAGELIPGYDTYSISACRLHCETSAVLQACNCRMVHMPGNATICPPNKTNCVDNALVSLLKKPSDSCPCETPCNLTRYGKELSMVKIPSRGSARYLSRKYSKSEDYIRDNFLVLDIFFEALNYETIEQKKAYDVAGLLGDIGGQMGLFIGASVLTVLEIFDYIYEVVKARLLRLVKPQKKDKKTDLKQDQRNTVATVILADKKEPSEAPRSHTEGAAYPTGILPNHHHHHHVHRPGLFEDFAC
ncbi:acid-sensing ion channel 4-A isoform X1 [Paramormyrops kingsleyae]|uniref:Acid-sensing (proton-gated) ion channel family member 4b n=1 Tax=Paramormyrops kingsleyae TaxID=1676925 RepID=A0A3B3SKL4_9TELE|nr:acid-sensing ion channel 4 isoform X1 [Paramormyrops kingsleyae]